MPRRVRDADGGIHEQHDRPAARLLGPSDDAGKGVPIVPVVQLEPERQPGIRLGDVVHADRGVHGGDDEAADARDALAHRELAVGVDPLLKAHGPTPMGTATSAPSSVVLVLTVATSTRTLGRKRQREYAASLSRRDSASPLPEAIQSYVGRSRTWWAT